MGGVVDGGHAFEELGEDEFFVVDGELNGDEWPLVGGHGGAGVGFMPMVEVEEESEQAE